MIKYQNNTISRLYGGNTPAYTLISGGTCVHGEYVQPSNTDLTTLTYDAPSDIIDTKTNLNASANTGVELIYSSDDTSIATVDSNGQIAPKASGTTTITIIASGTTIGNTTYRGAQKRLQIECDAPSSYVEVLSTAYINSSFDDNLHVTMNGSNANGNYYMFIIEASGNFTYTYNKKPEGTGGEVLQFESLMSEDFYTENQLGYDTAINQYWSETYNGNYNDPEAAQITVTGLPKGKYMLRFYVPPYKVKYGNIWTTTRRTMNGFFTIS